MKAAIYARVSDGRHQDVSNQLAQLKSYADAKSCTVVSEYVDGDSGAKADRPALQKLFDAASRREFDVVLVWALDRFTRQGVAQTFEYIKNLKTFGVEFESFTEPHFRTTGPAGELMIAIAAWIAEQERNRIRERVAAGIARAKEHGTKSGRPTGRPKATFHRDQVPVLREAGLTWNAISIKLGVPVGTCRREYAKSYLPNSRT